MKFNINRAYLTCLLNTTLMNLIENIIDSLDISQDPEGLFFIILKNFLLQDDSKDDGPIRTGHLAKLIMMIHKSSPRLLPRAIIDKIPVSRPEHEPDYPKPDIFCKQKQKQKHKQKNRPSIPNRNVKTPINSKENIKPSISSEEIVTVTVNYTKCCSNDNVEMLFRDNSTSLLKCISVAKSSERIKATISVLVDLIKIVYGSNYSKIVFVLHIIGNHIDNNKGQLDPTLEIMYLQLFMEEFEKILVESKESNFDDYCKTLKLIFEHEQIAQSRILGSLSNSSGYLRQVIETFPNVLDDNILVNWLTRLEFIEYLNSEHIKRIISIDVSMLQQLWDYNNPVLQKLIFDTKIDLKSIKNDSLVSINFLMENVERLSLSRPVLFDYVMNKFKNNLFAWFNDRSFISLFSSLISMDETKDHISRSISKYAGFISRLLSDKIFYSLPGANTNKDGINPCFDEIIPYYDIFNIFLTNVELLSGVANYLERKRIDRPSVSIIVKLVRRIIFVDEHYDDILIKIKRRLQTNKILVETINELDYSDLLFLITNPNRWEINGTIVQTYNKYYGRLDFKVACYEQVFLKLHLLIYSFSMSDKFFEAGHVNAGPRRRPRQGRRPRDQDSWSETEIEDIEHINNPSQEDLSTESNSWIRSEKSNESTEEISECYQADHTIDSNDELLDQSSDTSLIQLINNTVRKPREQLEKPREQLEKPREQLEKPKICRETQKDITHSLLNVYHRINKDHYNIYSLVPRFGIDRAKIEFHERACTNSECMNETYFSYHSTKYPYPSPLHLMPDAKESIRSRSNEIFYAPPDKNTANDQLNINSWRSRYTLAFCQNRYKVHNDKIDDLYLRCQKSSLFLLHVVNNVDHFTSLLRDGVCEKWQ